MKLFWGNYEEYVEKIAKGRMKKMGTSEMGNIPIVPVSRFPEGSLRKLAKSKAGQDNDPNKVDSKREWKELEAAARTSHPLHTKIVDYIKKESLEIVHIDVSLMQVFLLLGTLGTIYNVDQHTGDKTVAVVLKHEKVKALGIDFNEVFKDCGSPNTDWNENKYDKEINPNGIVNKEGYIVNLDLFQQVALLKALMEKKPELKKVKDLLGFHSYPGALSVNASLYDDFPFDELPRYTMWGVTKFIPGKYWVAQYPIDPIVSLETLGSLEGNKFFQVKICDGWVAQGELEPSYLYHGTEMLVVIGFKIPHNLEIF